MGLWNGTGTGVRIGTGVGIRPRQVLRLGPRSGSDRDQDRGWDQTGPRARTGVSLLLSRGGVPVLCPQPRHCPEQQLSRCSALLCGERDRGLSRLSSTRAPSPGPGARGAHSPRPQETLLRQCPRPRGFPRPGSQEPGPEIPFSLRPPLLPSRFPRDPSCSRVSQFWEVTLARGIQSARFPILAGLLPGSSCDPAMADCGHQPPAGAVTVTGQAAAAVCPLRHRDSVGSVAAVP